MCEGKGHLRSFGALDDYSHLLCFLDDGEKFINIDLADRSQKLKTETAPDHCSGGQFPLFILVEPLQAAAVDQPHVLLDPLLGHLDVRPELAGLIANLTLFD